MANVGYVNFRQFIGATGPNTLLAEYSESRRALVVSGLVAFQIWSNPDATELINGLQIPALQVFTLTYADHGALVFGPWWLRSADTVSVCEWFTRSTVIESSKAAAQNIIDAAIRCGFKQTPSE